MFTNSKWITSSFYPTMFPACFDGADVSAYFRRTFEVAEMPESALLSICVLGLGECTINGLAVTENVLTTPYTCYDKRVIYQTYDVTDLIKNGENVIGVHAGNGFYNNNMTTWNDYMSPWRDRPKMVAALKLQYASGKEEVIRTDDAWKTFPGPCLYNHMRQGEKFDAGKVQVGFDRIGFLAEGWENAVYTQGPGGILSCETTVPIKVKQVIKPVAVIGNIYDFGVNISGWAKIKVSGEAGKKITLTYGEGLKEDNSFTEASSAFARVENKPLQASCEFICSGRKEEEYRPTFCYFGFRYVKVENAPEEFEIEAQFVHSDLEVVGIFSSSDEMLNKIHEASVRSTLSNFVGIPTDCPHREQNGWTGDALFSCDQTLMNFEMVTAYAKWLRDFKDVQRPNGQLPGIIPSAGWGYNWGAGPAWDSSLILIPYTMYKHTGEVAIIKELWPVMTRYMSYMESRAVDDIADFGLGDWCASVKDVCPTAVTDTAYYYADSVAMAKMAEAIGEDSIHWKQNADRVKAAWRNAFWEKERYTGYQTFYACAIYQGLLEKEEIPGAAAKLANLVINNNYLLEGGTLAIKYLFVALSENGYADVLYKMVTNPEYPSYAYWINHGMTTLCESWEMGSSLNHHMYSEVDNWFYRYVGGIRFYDEGLTIDPVYLEDVEEVKVCHRGIEVHRVGRKVSVNLDMPAKIPSSEGYRQVMPGEYEFEL